MAGLFGKPFFYVAARHGLSLDLVPAQQIADRVRQQGRQTTRRYSLVGEGGYIGRRYRFRGCGHRDRDRGRNRDYRAKRVGKAVGGTVPTALPTSPLFRPSRRSPMLESDPTPVLHQFRPW